MEEHLSCHFLTSLTGGNALRKHSGGSAISVSCSCTQQKSDIQMHAVAPKEAKSLLHLLGAGETFVVLIQVDCSSKIADAAG